MEEKVEQASFLGDYSPQLVKDGAQVARGMTDQPRLHICLSWHG